MDNEKYNRYRKMYGNVERNYKKTWGRDNSTQATLILYGAAAIVGLVGVISLAVQDIHNPMVWKIAATFGGVVAATGLMCLIIGFFSFTRGCLGAFAGAAAGILAAMPGCMLVLAAFYSDWILGAIAGSLVGVPSGDNSYLYWVSMSLTIHEFQ